MPREGATAATPLPLRVGSCHLALNEFFLTEVAQHRFDIERGAKPKGSKPSVALILKPPEGYSVSGMAYSSQVLRKAIGRPPLLRAIGYGSGLGFGLAVATLGYLPLTIGTGYKVGMYDLPREPQEIANTVVGMLAGATSGGVSFSINGVINQGVVAEFFDGELDAVTALTRGEINPFTCSKSLRTAMRTILGAGALFAGFANALPFPKAVSDTLSSVSKDSSWMSFVDALYPINLATRSILVYRSADNALAYLLNAQCSKPVDRVNLLAQNAERIIDDLVARQNVVALHRVLSKFYTERAENRDANDLCWIKLLDELAVDYRSGSFLESRVDGAVVGIEPEITEGVVKTQVRTWIEYFRNWLGLEGFSTGQQIAAILGIAVALYCDYKYAMVQIAATEAGLEGSFGVTSAWSAVATLGAAVNLLFYADWSRAGVVDVVRFAGENSLGWSVLSFMMIASSAVPGTALALDNPHVTIQEVIGSTGAAAAMNGRPASTISRRLIEYFKTRSERNSLPEGEREAYDEAMQAKQFSRELGDGLKRIIRVATTRLTSAYASATVEGLRDQEIDKARSLTALDSSRRSTFASPGPGMPTLSASGCLVRGKAPFRSPLITTMLSEMHRAVRDLGADAESDSSAESPVGVATSASPADNPDAKAMPVAAAGASLQVSPDYSSGAALLSHSGGVPAVDSAESSRQRTTRWFAWCTCESMSEYFRGELTAAPE